MADARIPLIIVPESSVISQKLSKLVAVFFGLSEKYRPHPDPNTIQSSTAKKVKNRKLVAEAADQTGSPDFLPSSTWGIPRCSLGEDGMYNTSSVFSVCLRVSSLQKAASTR